MQRAPFAFSVIVPAHGRPAALEACLAGLARLDYPRTRFEVIVVDDASPVPLEAVLAPFRKDLEIRFVSRQTRGGPGAARNSGLEVAGGTYAAFTADDCVPAPDWLRQLEARLERLPEHAVGGRIVNALPENAFSTCTDLLICYLYARYNSEPHEARFFTPNNLVCPIDALRALGGFTPSFVTGEDLDLCERWRLSGRGLVYEPAAIVHHVHPLSFRTFCRLHFQYGQGSARYRHASARRRLSRVRFEAPSFYLDLLRYPLTEVRGPQAVVLSGLMGMAQLANAAGFVYQSWKAEAR